MKRHLFLLFTTLACSLLLSSLVIGQEVKPEDTEVWDPEPVQIDPGHSHTPPSDAIVLFDGTSTDAWQHRDGSAVKWNVADGVMTVKARTGPIFTKESFGDVQLHVEWRTPKEIVGEGQGRGNSGIFLQNRYEVQVLDSYQNRTYSNGQAGSVYKQYIPLVNASRAPGVWQTYDIIYRAPRFNDQGEKVSSAYLTVLHNGVLIQDHVKILGTTEYIGPPKNLPHGDAPIQLQDHGNPVSYRNIWLRRI